MMDFSISKSVRLQWIRWIPSERLSTPSSNMGEVVLSISPIEHGLFHQIRFVSNGSPLLVCLYTSTLPVFWSRARWYDWNLVDSIGQPSKCTHKMWQQTPANSYEALYDSTWFARSHVLCKSTSGMTNQQRGKWFVPIRSSRVELTTFLTHPA